MKRSFSILKNKYFLSTIVFVAILFIFEGTNVFQLFKMKQQFDFVKKENSRKIKEIKEVKNKTIQLTSNKEALEKFARENYRMKKVDEVVFLFIDKDQKK